MVAMSVIELEMNAMKSLMQNTKGSEFDFYESKLNILEGKKEVNLNFKL